MKKKSLLGWLAMLLAGATLSAQDAAVAPPESIVADGVPKIPAALAETAGRYGAYRSAESPTGIR